MLLYFFSWVTPLWQTTVYYARSTQCGVFLFRFDEGDLLQRPNCTAIGMVDDIYHIETSLFFIIFSSSWKHWEMRLGKTKSKHTTSIMVDLLFQRDKATENGKNLLVTWHSLQLKTEKFSKENRCFSFQFQF